MPFFKRPLPDLLLTFPFLALFFVQLAHHQPWRDELNVYGIAAASPTLGSLLWHVNHEGHPLVWYLVIWLAMKLFPSVLVLKIVQGFIGAGIIVLIGLASPLSRMERILLLLSYFALFEYTVMSRLYGVCVLFAMVFLWRRMHRPDSFLSNALLLGLMANTDTLGLFFSGAFGLEWVVNRYRQRTDKAAAKRQIIPAVILYLAMVVCCYLTIKPPADISWRTTGHIFAQGFKFDHVASVLIEYLALPWFPLRFLSHIRPGHYWNPISMDHPALYAALLLPVLAAYVLTFRRDPDLLAAFGLASLGAALFALIVFTGNMRNWGITFIAYVAALWLQRFRRPGVPRPAKLLLTLSAIAGVVFSILMWTRPFSNAEAAAAWLEANHLERAEIVGTPDASVASIAILMRRPIYFLDCRCSDNYLLFSSRRDDFSPQEMPEYTVQAFDKLHSERLILLLTAPMSPSERAQIEIRGAAVQPLAKFIGAEAPDEDFFVYRVTRRNG